MINESLTLSLPPDSFQREERLLDSRKTTPLDVIRQISSTVEGKDPDSLLNKQANEKMVGKPKWTVFDRLNEPANKGVMKKAGTNIYVRFGSFDS